MLNSKKNSMELTEHSKSAKSSHKQRLSSKQPPGRRDSKDVLILVVTNKDASHEAELPSE